MRPPPPQNYPQPPPSSGLESIGLALMGAILAVGGVVWATGQLAARLASGRWPRVAFSEIPPVLMSLRDHFGDPARAWPPQAAHLLPGPVGFYLTLTLILTPCIAAIWAALRLQGRSRRRE